MHRWYRRSFCKNCEPLLLGTPAEPPPPPPTATLDDLPAAWLEQLTAASLPAGSFWEGLLLKLWLEVGAFREELLLAEKCTAAWL